MTPMSKTQFPLQVVGFDALYGLEILSLGEEEATARVAVRDDVKQPAGLVHGGVFASIAESLTSIATWKAVSQDGMTAQGSPTRRASCARSCRARSTRPPAAATAAARRGSGRSTSPTTRAACAPSCG